MGLVLVLQLYVAILYSSRFVICDLCNSTVHLKNYSAWDQDKLPPSEFQLRLCTLRCNGTDLVDVGKEKNRALSLLLCRSCHCRQSCDRYGPCCLDISAENLYPNLADGPGYVLNNDRNSHIAKLDGEKFLAKNIRLDLGCFINKKPFPIERTCLPDYQDNVTVEYLCEADLLTEEQTLETYIKVLDDSTHVVYKNKFCALCNRVSK
ncbi:G-protein coupled receptor mth, partial [Biomphalaria glabrata]